MRSVALCVVFILCGCGRGPETELQDYLARLTRALDVSAAQDIALPPLTGRPGRRELALPEPESSINLLEFLSLSSCELGRVLGQRNSSLGKLAPPSQRLHTHRDILLSAPTCISELRHSDPSLAADLQRALEQKTSSRMHYWWNAWMTSNEWLAFSSPAAQALSHGDAGALTIAAALEALDYAIRQGLSWSGSPPVYSYDAGLMEHYQQQWLVTKALGAWRQSQRLLTQTSIQAASQLDKRLGPRPLCPAGVKTPQAEIVHTVFAKFYAAQLQPYLSMTDRFGEALLIRLKALSDLTDAPAVWSVWMSDLKLEKAALRDAHMQHVRKWQALLRQCGMMPGQDTSQSPTDTTE